MDTNFHHAPWGTGCGKAQFSLCEISAYAPPAIEAYSEWHWDGDGAAEDAPAKFLERITVNFIRHNLTAYDRALEEVAGRVGIASAVQGKDLLSHRRAIGESYPALADECSRQLMRRGL
jgi:hypothetical protein